MAYDVISADGHIDLIWLPPDLFTSQASGQMKERMPYVIEGENGPKWVSKNGSEFGLMNGMGSAGREYIPGQIARSDRMAETGLYDDGKKGIRRLTDPALRIKDQERDGVRGEVLYGILGASQRLNDPEAAAEMMTIYNDWLADFCNAAPDRFAGIAPLPNNNVPAAVEEIERVAKRGAVKGIEIANSHDMLPLYHPDWDPLWAAANEAKLPVHVHTIGTPKIDTTGFAPLQQRQAFAVQLTGFQMGMSRVLMEVIYGGILEKYTDVKLVIGESGIGWIPYVLEHMDLEWEEQFKDLTLTMKPSEYWYRQCRATYQSDNVGLKLIDELGEDNVMWGSDFPHPDGVWPDSQEFLEREVANLSDSTRRKVICENAAKLYGFPLQ